MSTCNRWDLQTLGFQPVITPKNLPDHCSKMTSTFSRSLDELQPVISQSQPVHLYLTAGYPRPQIWDRINTGVMWSTYLSILASEPDRSASAYRFGCLLLYEAMECDSCCCYYCPPRDLLQSTYSKAILARGGCLESILFRLPLGVGFGVDF